MYRYIFIHVSMFDLLTLSLWTVLAAKHLGYMSIRPIILQLLVFCKTASYTRNSTWYGISKKIYFSYFYNRKIVWLLKKRTIIDFKKTSIIQINWQTSPYHVKNFYHAIIMKDIICKIKVRNFFVPSFFYYAIFLIVVFLLFSYIIIFNQYEFFVIWILSSNL